MRYKVGDTVEIGQLGAIQITHICNMTRGKCEHYGVLFRDPKTREHHAGWIPCIVLDLMEPVITPEEAAQVKVAQIYLTESLLPKLAEEGHHFTRAALSKMVEVSQRILDLSGN